MLRFFIVHVWADSQHTVCLRRIWILRSNNLLVFKHQVQNWIFSLQVLSGIWFWAWLVKINTLSCRICNLVIFTWVVCFPESWNLSSSLGSRRILNIDRRVRMVVGLPLLHSLWNRKVWSARLSYLRRPISSSSKHFLLDLCFLLLQLLGFLYFFHVFLHSHWRNLGLVAWFLWFIQIWLEGKIFIL